MHWILFVKWRKFIRNFNIKATNMMLFPKFHTEIKHFNQFNSFNCTVLKSFFSVSKLTIRNFYVPTFIFIRLLKPWNFDESHSKFATTYCIYRACIKWCNLQFLAPHNIRRNVRLKPYRSMCSAIFRRGNQSILRRTGSPVVLFCLAFLSNRSTQCGSLVDPIRSTWVSSAAFTVTYRRCPRLLAVQRPEQRPSWFRKGDSDRFGHTWCVELKCFQCKSSWWFFK